MGYNGGTAMALKEAYIAEFDRMEAELANRVAMKKDPSRHSAGALPLLGGFWLIHSLAP